MTATPPQQEQDLTGSRAGHVPIVHGGKRVAFVVNGSAQSAMGIRAQSFAKELSDYEIRTFFRGSHKILSIAQLLIRLAGFKPGTTYVFDMSFSGVVAAFCYRCLSPCRIIIDTGDAISSLAESVAERNWLGRKLTRLLEYCSIYWSDALVVRGQYHQEILKTKKQSVWLIPDGVDIAEFKPLDSGSLRRCLGLEGFFTVGFIGSLTWNHKWQVCYGWELLEALALIPELPIKGVIIGDGNGLAKLRMLALQKGISDRVVFLGRLPYAELPGPLNCIDICLSTQSNDLAGSVRTTGKLPLYLACGRHVLSTSVGEAKRILPAEMLLEYQGVRDDDYPARLAARIRELFERRPTEMASQRSRNLACQRFDYSVLAAAMRDVIEGADAHCPSLNE